MSETGMHPPGAIEHNSKTNSLASLIESLPAAAFACDAEGRIVAFNEQAERLWGRRPALNDFAQRFCGSVALFEADGSPMLPERCATALALTNGRGYEGCEAVILRPDGSRRTVLYSAAPLRDEDGNVSGATAVLVDITHREREQHLAQAALERSEMNFRGFFDSVAVGALQVNAEGRIFGCNDRYCEITGYTRAELLTMTPFDLDHPDDREADLDRVLKALADPAGIYHVEKRYVRKDGTIRWVHVAANILRDAAHQPVQTAAIVLDISERRRAEDALKEADRLKDEFLATLAHELRNPLSPLMSAAELLRQADAVENDWCRSVIERQVSHLSRLIDDLLDVSRITRDKLELRKERIELSEVIRNAVEASRPILEHCEQTLTTSLPTEPVYLNGDLVRLTQVFTNLLTNAAKFTNGPGGIRLAAVRDAEHVWITLEDSGIGIADEELSRIFDKFYQSPRRAERVLGGLGIGLSLVRRLVELHGGDVEARSAGLGAGSEFVVRLPLATAETQAIASPQERGGAGRRVLIVDDNIDGADALARLLQLMGHDAVTEYDGPSALERAEKFHPDIVFLDLGMPGMDGFEVCRRLREQRPTMPPRIVALTGWGRKEDVARTKQAGFDAHLVKPANRATLQRLLAETDVAAA